MDKRALFKEFEKITDELLSIDMSKNTDDILDEIEEKLKKREELINEIKSIFDEEIFSDDDLLIIVEKNNRLKTKFIEIKLGISNSINEVLSEKKLSSVKKKAHRGYLNLGYQKDGYFIDKKK